MSNPRHRANSNKMYGRNDFDAWIRGIINDLSFDSVLDLCCGDGNQLEIYAQTASCVVGVDSFEKPLALARKKLWLCDKRWLLIQKKIETVFENIGTFDLVACCYGLYYSEDPKKTLLEMLEYADKTVLIVGPYGRNNESLFSLLEQYYELSREVVYSSTDFMEKDVFPILAEHTDVTKHTFVNPICYPDVESLIAYWKSSTFYSPEHEEGVTKAMKNHFAKHETFTVEKHIMAYVGKKR